jgi:three-Cys-motif partner protein
VTTKCFFSESNRDSYRQLEKAVKPFHSPDKGFFIKTFEGEFEKATADIVEYIDRSFALVFIDPTGWTGYAYDSITPVLRHEPGEVLINFMYDFVNRAAAMSDAKTVASLDPIMGGPGWKSRLTGDLPPGQEIERTFREVLKAAGCFKHVLSTRIDKATADRPHFFLAYGTRKDAGLKAFREVEHVALRGHERLRAKAKQEKRQSRTGQNELFGPEESAEQSFEEIANANYESAKTWIVSFLEKRGHSIPFGVLILHVLELFVVRETDIKDICVELAKGGKIENTWKALGKKKPIDRCAIALKTDGQ